MTPQTLIIGANGFIGSYFYRSYRSLGLFALGTSNKKQEELSFFDLASSTFELSKFPEINWTHILIAAGIALPSRCEQAPEDTFRCNVEACVKIAKEAYAHGIIPIILSSDYVFDGKSAPYALCAPPNPLNRYGQQKVELEKRVLEETKGNCLILRLSKIYSLQPRDGTLLSSLIDHFLNSQVVNAATDQFFSPLCIEDLFESTLHLQKSRHLGIVHCSGNESISRYELAKMVAKKMVATEYHLKKISLEEIEDGVVRPLNTTLISSISCKWTIDKALTTLMAQYGIATN